MLKHEGFCFSECVQGHTLTSVGVGIARQTVPPQDSKRGSAAHLASPEDCRKTNGAPSG